jgi:lauroyl/myristoyl acyltransferase
LPRLLDLTLPLRTAATAIAARWSLRADERRPLSLSRVAGVTLTATFGETMSSAELRRLARRCVVSRAVERLDHEDLQRGGRAHRVLNAGPLLDLKRRGQGAMVCGIHLGPYHYVPLELLGLGCRVVTIAADPLLEKMRERWVRVAEGLDGRFEAYPVLGAQSLLRLMRAVRGGAMGVVYLDGQSGVGGPGGGMHHHKVFDFLGVPSRARIGSTYLAHRAGVPTVLAAAYRDALGRRVVEFSDPYPAPPRTDADGPERLLHDIAPWFERRIREYPDQWVGWLMPILTWGATGTSPTASQDDVQRTRSRVRTLLEDRRGRTRLVADPVRVGALKYEREQLIVEGRRRLILSVTPLSARVLELAQRRERVARLPERTGAGRDAVELEVTRMVLAGIATLEPAEPR